MHNPNIVVYIGHDVGRFIEPYGIETVHTPNLNRLAEEGVVFDNHFATAPQCSPSRASMFTGRCPHSTGVLGLTGGPFGWTLNEDEQHLARLLGAAGYETALIGIAHEALGGNCPDEQVKICGFDDASRHGQKDARRAGGALADWLSTREQPDSPFFVEIGTRAIHHAHQFEPEDENGVTVPEHLNAGPETERYVAQHQACVRYWDEGLGRVLDVLDERNLADNTIVVATTDHGLGLPRAKTSLYDPGLESLLLMRYPRGIEGGQRHDCLLSNVDLTPTMLEAAGAEAPDSIHGRSFWPLVTGADYLERTEIFGEKTYHTEYDPMRCIRTERYKFIYNFEPVTHEHFGRGCMNNRGVYQENLHLRSSERQSCSTDAELYDLKDDPLEMNNLAGKSEYAGVRRDLEKRLYEWMEETDDPLLEGPVAAPAFYDRVAYLQQSAERN